VRVVRRIVPPLLLVVGSVAFALGLVEAYLRVSGSGPALEPPPVTPLDGLHMEDPILGWQNEPGEHVTARPGGQPGQIRFTVLPDGSRTTGPPPLHPAAEVIVVGCSFTQGWGLDDAETYAWLLQERLPNVAVHNFGTGGYGTYQSLLRVERVLAAPSPVPRFVVYGFAHFHEQRNVAAHDWLRTLATGSRGTARVPYCSFDRDGRLERMAPIGYRTWPFHRVLASVRLLEDRLEAWAAPRREQYARPITQALLGEMDGVARDARARLLVVELVVRGGATKSSYEAYAREHGIDVADCTSAEFNRMDMRLRLPDLHPNATMNRLWAECIERELRARMGAAATGTPAE
jgi:hypothetical protein